MNELVADLAKSISLADFVGRYVHIAVATSVIAVIAFIALCISVRKYYADYPKYQVVTGILTILTVVWVPAIFSYSESINIKKLVAFKCDQLPGCEIDQLYQKALTLTGDSNCQKSSHF